MSMTDAKALRTQAHPLGGSFADRSAAQYRKPSRANLSAGERDHWHILLPKRGEPCDFDERSTLKGTRKGSPLFPMLSFSV